MLFDVIVAKGYTLRIDIVYVNGKIENVAYALYMGNNLGLWGE